VPRRLGQAVQGGRQPALLCKVSTVPIKPTVPSML
jgi:hypothetical protein